MYLIPAKSKTGFGSSMVFMFRSEVLEACHDKDRFGCCLLRS